MVDFDKAEGAFLGAAIGDAMGWPFEMRTRKSGRPHELAYKNWTKHAGGRFLPHDEQIDAGSYSDDTQLILAGARSLTRHPARWWHLFAMQELPFWTLYQRGGGGATKRAASSWLSGRAPWDGKDDDVARYFQAGGNGVAMRVLPHCIRHADKSDFTALARDIVTDGVCTHGHPKALVGGLAYGFALWKALRHQGTLGYGELLDSVINDFDAWSRFVVVDDRWPTWSRAAGDQLDYSALWAEAMQEQLSMLRLVQAAMAEGVAAVDEDTLEALGCFKKEINGAGTVNAAAALYLASRHAADPIEGLKQAAFAEGADTDTLASMTAALLGAAIGQEWLSSLAQPLQDSRTIRSVARALYASRQVITDPDSFEPVTRPALTRFLQQLNADGLQSEIVLPLGLSAHAASWDGVSSRAENLNVKSWRLTFSDGQTIFIKEFKKAQRRTLAPFSSSPDGSEAREPPMHIGVRLPVSNVSITADFYQKVLGLPITKRSRKTVSLGGLLSFYEADHAFEGGQNLAFYFEVPNLGSCLNAYKRFMSDPLINIDERKDRLRLQCTDPDGYKLEIYTLANSTRS